MDTEANLGSVLIIEDEHDIRLMMVRLLKQAGFQVFSAETGEDGIMLAREHQPTVITLDRMLPGMDGITVCKTLREDPETSDLYVLMITAMGDTEDRIDGLESGADDYLSKPFQNKEMLLRVKAGAKRVTKFRKQNASTASDEANNSKQKYGRLEVDDVQHRVWIDGGEVNMTITEYKLLGHMIGKNNALCSRGELLEHVWELPPTLNTRTVDTHVKRLRQKMGPLSNYIETVRGAGYRFCVPSEDRS